MTHQASFLGKRISSHETVCRPNKTALNSSRLLIGAWRDWLTKVMRLCAMERPFLYSSQFVALPHKNGAVLG
jgi:hypothetical protein